MLAELCLKSFYWTDLAVAAGLLLLALRPPGRLLDGQWTRLFWLGVGIGLLWEVPIFLSALYGHEPVLLFWRRPPLSPLLFMLAHALWDGGLFLAGVGLLRFLSPTPLRRGWRWPEVGMMLLWGQVSALAVEIGGVRCGGWVYAADRAWNPVLLDCAGRPLTLLPQAIWLLAPLLYYGLALRLVAREARP